MLCDCRDFEGEGEREGAVKALGLVDTPIDDPRFNAITKSVLTLSFGQGGVWVAAGWLVVGSEPLGAILLHSLQRGRARGRL